MCGRRPTVMLYLLLALSCWLPLGCGGPQDQPAGAGVAPPGEAVPNELPEADASPELPPLVECPHAVPTDGTPCVPPNYAACTYPAEDPRCERLAATCRAGLWSVACIPPFQPMLL